MNKLFHRHRQTAEISGAALTPMVDLFTILVIAVLRASSPEPPLESLEADLQLPISRTEVESEKGASIEIGVDGIALEGIRMGSTIYWEKQEAILMPELKSALLMMSPGAIQIRAHAEAPWAVVNKALYTAQQSGVKDVEIIALSASSL